MPRTRSQTTNLDNVKITSFTSRTSRTNRATLKSLRTGSNNKGHSISENAVVSKKLKGNNGAPIGQCAEIKKKVRVRTRNPDSTSSTATTSSTSAESTFSTVSKTSETSVTSSTNSSSSFKENEQPAGEIGIVPLHVDSILNKEQKPSIELEPASLTVDDVFTKVPFLNGKGDNKKLENGELPAVNKNFSERSPLSSKTNGGKNKRKRQISSEIEPFDFNNSPKSGKTAVEQLLNTAKRNKISSSPRHSKPQLDEDSSSELIEKISQVPAKVLEKNETSKILIHPPAAANKKLSIKERIAKLKADQAAKKKAAESLSVPGSSDSLTTAPATPSPSALTAPPTSAASKKANLLQQIQKAKLQKLKHQQEQEKISQKLDSLPKLKPLSACTITKDEIKQITSEVLRTFNLPVTYQKLRKMFKKLDEIIITLNNRKEVVTMSRLKRDVTRYHGSERFGDDTLKQIIWLKANSFILDWKRGLRMDDQCSESTRIKSENYQLAVRPDLSEFEEGAASQKPPQNKTPTKQPPTQSSSHSHSTSSSTPINTWAKMKISHLQARLADFTKRLQKMVENSHFSFLKTNKKELKLTDSEINKCKFDQGMKNYHATFDLEKDCQKIGLADFPLHPGSDSLYSTPQHSEGLLSSLDGSGKSGPRSAAGGSLCGTPLSARKLLNSFCQKEKEKMEHSGSIDSGTESMASQAGPSNQSLSSVSAQAANAQPLTTAAAATGSGSGGLQSSAAQLRAELEVRYKDLPPKLREKNIKRRLKEQEQAMFKEKLNTVKEKQEMTSLFDIARGIKSYFTITKSSAGLLADIGNKIVKTSSSELNFGDVIGRIEKLSSLQMVRDYGMLEVEKASDGNEYLKMKRGATLKGFNDAIKLSIERLG